jgi:hypothetical protein
MEAPWLVVDAVDRREVPQVVVRVIAAWLECDRSAFEVVVDG